MANQQQIQYPKQAIMLDVSLFILDLLDQEKIKMSVMAQDHILEVPSALVLMMRDAKSGSPIFFLLLYSLLNKFIQEQKRKQIQSRDPRIVNLLYSTDYQIRQKVWEALKNFSDHFSMLITPQTQKITSSEQIFPIKSYTEITSMSLKEQEKLQRIYTNEFGLPQHPLYDQYFAQVHHALSARNQGLPNFIRKNISLNSATFIVISKWKKKVWLSKERDQNIISHSRALINWFTLTYVKDTWKDLIFDTTLSVEVDFAQTGRLGTSSVTLVAGTILPKDITQIPLEILTPTERTILFIFIIIFLCACAVITTQPLWYASLSAKLTPSPIPSPTFSIQTLPVTFTPSATISLTSTFTPSPTPSPSPTATRIISNFQYCRYVTQPGDTAQSISAWFGISEDIYRAENNSHPGTEFTKHNMVTINAPCCNSRYPDGTSYVVRQGDTISSIARERNISAEYLARANNLKEPWYIQTDQMLCIP